MKKLLSLFTLFIVLLGFNVADAATSGSKGTATITVKTKANWYKPGQESITIQTDPRNGITGIYNVYLDGKYYGRLGNPNANKYNTSKYLLKILLGRNKTHKIKVVYDLATTKAYYKKINRRNMPSSFSPFWKVANDLNYKIDWVR